MLNDDGLARFHKALHTAWLRAQYKGKRTERSPSKAMRKDCPWLLIALHRLGALTSFSVFDVGNAYANTPQSHCVFVCQPPGYADGSDDVLELKRALYGQRDAGRQFWLHLESVLLAAGYTRPY